MELIGLTKAVALTTRTFTLSATPTGAYFLRGGVHLELRDINKAKGDLQRAAQLFRNQGNTSSYQRTIRLLNSL